MKVSAYNANYTEHFLRRVLQARIKNSPLLNNPQTNQSVTLTVQTLHPFTLIYIYCVLLDHETEVLI
jgi:hypothetical protein